MKTARIPVVVCFLVALCSISQAQTPLRIARIENIPDQWVGGEILKVVYGRLNIPIELVDMPAKRALLDSSSGRLDGEVHRNIHVQEQYPSLILLRPAINYIEPSVFSKNLHFAVKGWDSIKDYSIGIVRGVGTSEDGTMGMKRVLAVTTMEQLMQLLDAERVDVAVSDSFSGLAVIMELGLGERIRVLAPPLQKTDIYHFLHEKHRDLIPRVERVLREMQANGELESLRRQNVERHLARLESKVRAK